MEINKKNGVDLIHFSCYSATSRSGEQFIPQHVLGYMMAGTSVAGNGKSTITINAGDVFFGCRNQLLKYEKVPPPGGEFRSVSIMFSQEVLLAFSLKYGYSAAPKAMPMAYKMLNDSPELAAYMKSLHQYETLFEKDPKSPLLQVKQEEALLLLLSAHPDLADTLFDFAEPGKIDLEAFMNRNYHFNVGLERFAYLTGRSLSTFKRDFVKIFSLSPSRWLLQRRLQEAYYLLTERKQAVKDVYIDLGFEDLSHFSYAFKKKYGIAPSFI